MRRKSLVILSVLVTTATASSALAAGDHGGSPGKAPMQREGAMQGQGSGAGHGGMADMAGMMDMMMKMHAQMMDGGMMGGMGGPAMMGQRGSSGQPGMMGGSGMMGKPGMMGGSGMMGQTGSMPGSTGMGMGRGMMFGMGADIDTDGDGRIGADELRAEMSQQLSRYDADGDGALSLEEFEALHAAMIRDATVDRFQFFDNDGDGSVTEAEMHAPVNRMSMMERFQGAPATSSDGADDMMEDQSGSMMNDN